MEIGPGALTGQGARGTSRVELTGPQSRALQYVRSLSVPPNTLRGHHLLLVSKDKENDQIRILSRAKIPKED